MAHFKTRMISAGWALGAAVALGGCTNMETMPGPSSPGQTVACTMEYAPVCGGKGHRRKTFSNACMAKADGYSVVKEGACVG
jgi:hypothetical protein